MHWRFFVYLKLSHRATSSGSVMEYSVNIFSAEWEPYFLIGKMPVIPGFQNPVELQPLRAKDGCTGVGFLHDMGSRVLGLDVADLTFNALLCRRDAAM